MLDHARRHQSLPGHDRTCEGLALWPISPPIKQFHAPDDALADLRPAAEAAGISDYQIVPIEVPAGTAVFHHGRTWHGSRDNKGANPRRSVIAHCVSSTAKFHPHEISYIYSRYKKAQSSEMDESYFPVLWQQDGYRTAWLDGYMRSGRAAAA